MLVNDNQTDTDDSFSVNLPHKMGMLLMMLI